VSVPVVKRDMPIYLEGLGNVTAFYTVTVKTQVDGRIDRIAFREGQAVKKGDLIAQIDPRPFQAVLHQAEATLAKDRATVSQNKLTYDRQVALKQDNLASQQTVDDARAALEVAQAVTVSDAATIDAARLNIEYARIVSPIDGITGIRLVDVGNIVHPSDASGLVVITQIDPIAVIFTLPQDDLPRVSKAMSDGPVPVEAMSRDGSTLLGKGLVALIDNQINQTTATIRLKAILPNEKKLLWPNQFVKARLLLKTEPDAIVVPAAVVQRGPDGTFAYVVGPDNRVSVRPVTVATLQGETAILSSGLSAGEVVVTEGQYQLRPGARVAEKTVEKRAGTTGGAETPAKEASVPPSGSAAMARAASSAEPWKPGATP
jgi:multidrug efflux system membrane fusion protein